MTNGSLTRGVTRQGREAWRTASQATGAACIDNCPNAVVSFIDEQLAQGEATRSWASAFGAAQQHHANFAPRIERILAADNNSLLYVSGGRQQRLIGTTHGKTTVSVDLDGPGLWFAPGHANVGIYADPTAASSRKPTHYILQQKESQWELKESLRNTDSIHACISADQSTLLSPAGIRSRHQATEVPVEEVLRSKLTDCQASPNGDALGVQNTVTFTSSGQQFRVAELYAIGPDGKIRWEKTVEDFQRVEVSGTGDKLLVLAESSVNLIDMATGQQTRSLGRANSASFASSVEVVTVDLTGAPQWHLLAPSRPLRLLRTASHLDSRAHSPVQNRLWVDT